MQQTQTPFVKNFCHWSHHENRTTHGCEGILILSKITCEVTYGMGNKEFDTQARVATIEFTKIFLVVSYHPQGGFSEESLGFKAPLAKMVPVTLKCSLACSSFNVT